MSDTRESDLFMTAAETVTLDNFVQAESARYFRAQVANAPVNTYFHNRVPVSARNQVMNRSAVDLIYSYAVVDVTEQATFSVSASEEFQVDQIIDQHHHTLAVVYPGQTHTVRRADLSGGTHVYVLGRTSTANGIERAHALQDARRIEAATANVFIAPDYDEASRQHVGAELDARAGEIDFSRAFGAPGTTDPFHHLLGTRLGWGGLPDDHAQFFQAAAIGTGADVWTFPVPPLDYAHSGYFAVIKYDANGWLDVTWPGFSDRELVRNGDGTISIWFGDSRCVDQQNVIETAEGQHFIYGLRLYRPADAAETRRYLEELGTRGLTPADPRRNA
ncbi:hypothetical protein AAFP35_06535 [Gordonia sp. CPCC 206044]|uniref:hypothetical protein n=1 Tax=Gordonia sp. CPCC 206044 TaxID=3140793 RepID=UPI003AF3BB0C